MSPTVTKDSTPRQSSNAEPEQVLDSTTGERKLSEHHPASADTGTRDNKESAKASAGTDPHKHPYYVQPSAINTNNLNTFVSLPGTGGYVTNPIYTTVSDSFSTTAFRPAYDFQVDPVTGYLSGLYSGNGAAMSTQNAGVQHAQVALGQASMYGIYGSNTAFRGRSLHHWSGNHVLSGQKPLWNALPSCKFKTNLAGPRRYSKLPQFSDIMGHESLCDGQSKIALASASGSEVTPTNSPQSSPRSTTTHASSTSPQTCGTSVSSSSFSSTISAELLAKLVAGKGIPPPVPSLFAGPSLEDAMGKSLYNPNQTTNVYIRGLPPDTTDAKLHEICERFGEITSSKAILEVQTNTCKGFGFACFKHESEATACIAGLLHCGYQVSFAKESFSTRLKNLQDPQSTNLYLSNLPAAMHEKDLELLFQPYKVISNRILRDSNNVSRGVGFARLSDRESAEAIIDKFDNKPLTDDVHALPLQVRFADSPNQKRLKGQTQRRRQWRAREYNLLTGNIVYPGVHENIIADASSGVFLQGSMQPVSFEYVANAIHEPQTTDEIQVAACH